MKRFSIISTPLFFFFLIETSITFTRHDRVMPFLGVRISQELKNRLDATGRPSSQVVREALELYFGIVREHERTALEMLIDQRIESYIGQSQIFKTNSPTQKRHKETKVRSFVPSPSLTDVLIALQEFHRGGHEPSASELAGKVGMAPGPLSALLKGQGIENRSVRRGGKSLRIYPFDLGPLVEETLDLLRD